MDSALLRGDLRRAGSGAAVVLALGKYSMIGVGCVVRPPYKTYKGCVCLHQLFLRLLSVLTKAQRGFFMCDLIVELLGRFTHSHVEDVGLIGGMYGTYQVIIP